MHVKRYSYISHPLLLTNEKFPNYSPDPTKTKPYKSHSMGVALAVKLHVTNHCNCMWPAAAITMYTGACESVALIRYTAFCPHLYTVVNARFSNLFTTYNAGSTHTHGCRNQSSKSGGCRTNVFTQSDM